MIKSYPFRNNTLIISALLALCSFSLFGQSSIQSLENSEKTSHSNETVILSEKDKVIIERMQLASIEDVQLYIREVLNADIPEHSQINEKYLNLNNYLAASELLGKDHPFFYQHNGIELINKVKSNPIEFREMIIKYKLLRRHYDEY